MTSDSNWDYIEDLMHCIMTVDSVANDRGPTAPLDQNSPSLERWCAGAFSVDEEGVMDMIDGELILLSMAC